MILVKSIVYLVFLMQSQHLLIINHKKKFLLSKFSICFSIHLCLEEQFKTNFRKMKKKNSYYILIMFLVLLNKTSCIDYLGCFKDCQNGKRDLNVFLNSISSQSVNRCVSDCKGYNYAGVQFRLKFIIFTNQNKT